jgi:hypothetical protein
MEVSLTDALLSLQAKYNCLPEAPALDTDKSQELLIRSVCMACSNKLPFHLFKTFTEWLGCYNYIPPDKRELDPYVAERLQEWYLAEDFRASKVFITWQMCDLIETTLPLKRQREILLWMHE